MHTHPGQIPAMEKELREHGIPVAELCRQAGIAETTWGRWKKGVVSPTFKSWGAVSKAYQSLLSNNPAKRVA